MPAMLDDIPPLDHLIGLKTTATDTVTAAQVQRLAATLNRDDRWPRQGDPVPPGWHIAFFPNTARTDALGSDGLLRDLGDDPAFAAFNRMYAGQRMRFLKPLRVGEDVTLESEIVSATPKRGRSGDLIFATQRSRISGPDGVATEDERDMVFVRPHPDANRAGVDSPPAPENTQWRKTVATNPVLLFRFSAITFNPHRIHYDYTYVTGEEGFPDLVVHGPLTMILLLELAREHSGGRALTEFHMRAMAPLFVGPPVTLLGNPTDGGKACELWAVTPQGRIAMAAGASFA